MEPHGGAAVPSPMRSSLPLLGLLPLGALAVTLTVALAAPAADDGVSEVVRPKEAAPLAAASLPSERAGAAGPDLSLAGTTVAQAFPPPPGSARVAPGAFGSWLQGLRLEDAAAPVLTHDGRVVRHRGRVVQLPLVEGDLQQCADAILRLRAEWLRERGEPVSFFATSGDPIPWARFQAGERPHVEGRRLAWTGGHGPSSWDGYLRRVFEWAGTISLRAHETRPVDEPRPGDILVEAGSPGHAVVLLDVATAEDGSTWVLVAESYMPAQDLHVELGPAEGWWPLTEDGLALPHWPLEREGLRRFTGD